MNLLQIHELDTVVTCLDPLSPGQSIQWAGQNIVVKDAIDVFHKMAVQPMPKGGQCLKYGQCIGVATVDIAPGQHVHTHNIESLRGRGNLDRQAARGRLRRPTARSMKVISREQTAVS